MRLLQLIVGPAKGAAPGYAPSENWAECRSPAVVIIGYVNSADVISEARLPFKTKEGSLKLSVRRDIITEDMLGC